MKPTRFEELILLTNPNTFAVYQLYQHTVEDRIAYSIAIEDRFGHRAFVEDVTDDYEAAKRFLQLLCQEDAEPCHLFDLVEDSLPLR